MKTQSETIGKIALALSKAQSEFEPIVKFAKGYNYKYAPLDICYKATRKALTANELAVVHSLNHKEGREQVLVTTLVHSSGEYFISYTDISTDQNKQFSQKAPQAIQQWGAALTYLRRYTYCSIIGAIGEDEDTDDIDSSFNNHPRSNGDNNDETSNLKLASLIKKSGHDPIAFATYHGITSKNPETVKNAINNFKELEATYRSSKNNSTENLSVTH